MMSDNRAVFSDQSLSPAYALTSTMRMNPWFSKSKPVQGFPRLELGDPSSIDHPAVWVTIVVVYRRDDHDSVKFETGHRPEDERTSRELDHQRENDTRAIHSKVIISRTTTPPSL
jgi:hypothetical protein